MVHLHRFCPSSPAKYWLFATQYSCKYNGKGHNWEKKTGERCCSSQVISQRRLDDSVTVPPVSLLTVFMHTQSKHTHIGDLQHIHIEFTIREKTVWTTVQTSWRPSEWWEQSRSRTAWRRQRWSKGFWTGSKPRKGWICGCWSRVGQRSLSLSLRLWICIRPHF